MKISYIELITGHKVVIRCTQIKFSLKQSIMNKSIVDKS